MFTRAVFRSERRCDISVDGFANQAKQITANRIPTVKPKRCDTADPVMDGEFVSTRRRAGTRRFGGGNFS